MTFFRKIFSFRCFHSRSFILPFLVLLPIFFAACFFSQFIAFLHELWAKKEKNFGDGNIRERSSFMLNLSEKSQRVFVMWWG